MRKEMVPIAEALLAIGDKGKITAFGFTDEELGEFVSMEREYEKFYEQTEREWKSSLQSRDDRERMFPEVTEAQAFEWRQRWYLQQYEDTARRFFEAEKEGYEQDILKRYKARMNHAKEVYEIFTYRPYDNKTIPDHEIQKARERSIGDFIQLDRRGFAPCPFHNEKTPSFHVHQKWNRFYCFGCGAKGDSIEFIRKLNGLGFQESVKYLQL